MLIQNKYQTNKDFKKKNPTNIQINLHTCKSIFLMNWKEVSGNTALRTQSTFETEQEQERKKDGL